MRRCGSISSPFAAASMLVLLVAVAGCFHCSSAARLLPSSSPSVPVIPALVVRQAENGVTAAPGAADSDELPISEMMGAEEACEEGSGGEEECMQRRLLHEAHLDYIYTQHKGKP